MDSVWIVHGNDFFAASLPTLLKVFEREGLATSEIRFAL